MNEFASERESDEPSVSSETICRSLRAGAAPFSEASKDELMEACILKHVRQVTPYVDRVRRLADQHRNEFAFLPETSYADAAMRGNIWVAVDRISKKFRAYVYFGGRVPRMRVFQICVQPERRDSGIARRLVSELVKHGIESGYLNITARVSSKLEANRF